MDRLSNFILYFTKQKIYKLVCMIQGKSTEHSTNFSYNDNTCKLIMAKCDLVQTYESTVGHEENKLKENHPTHSDDNTAYNQVPCLRHALNDAPLTGAVMVNSTPVDVRVGLRSQTMVASDQNDSQLVSRKSSKSSNDNGRYTCGFINIKQ